MSEQSASFQLTGTLMLRCSSATLETIQRELRRQIARFNPHAADQALQQLLTSADLGQVFLRDVFRLDAVERIVRGQWIRLDLHADHQTPNPLKVLFLVDNATWNKNLNGDGRVWAFVGLLRNVGDQIVCFEIQRLLVLHTESNTKLVSRLHNAVPCACAFVTEQEARNQTLELNNDRTTWQQVTQLPILDPSHWNQFRTDVREVLSVDFAQEHGLRYLYAHYQRETQRIQFIVFSPTIHQWQEIQQNLSVVPLDLYELPKQRGFAMEWGRVQPKDFRQVQDNARSFMPRRPNSGTPTSVSLARRLLCGDLTWLQEARFGDTQANTNIVEENTHWQQDSWESVESHSVTREPRNLHAWHFEVPAAQWSSEINEVYQQLTREWQGLHQIWSNPSATPEKLATYIQRTHQVDPNAKVSVAEAMQLAQHLTSTPSHSPQDQANLLPVLELLRRSESKPFHVIELGLSPALTRELFNSKLPQQGETQEQTQERVQLEQERILAPIERQLPRSGLLLPRYFRIFTSLAQQYNNLNLLTQTQNFAIPYAPSYLYNTSQVTNAIGSVGSYTSQLLRDNQRNSDYDSLINFASYNSELGVVNIPPHTNQNLFTAEMLSYIAARGQTVLYVARDVQQLELFNNYLQHAPQVISVRLDSVDALPMRYYYRALSHSYNEQHLRPLVRCQELQHEFRTRLAGLSQYNLNLETALVAHRSVVERQNNIEGELVSTQQQLEQAEVTLQRARINLDNLERILRMLKLERIRPEQWSQPLDFTAIGQIFLEQFVNPQVLGLNLQLLNQNSQQRLQDYVAGRLARDSQDTANLLFDLIRCYADELQPLLQQLKKQATEKAAVNYAVVNSQLEHNREQRVELQRNEEELQQVEQERAQLQERITQAAHERSRLLQRQEELRTQIQDLQQQLENPHATPESTSTETPDLASSQVDDILESDFAGFAGFSAEFADSLNDTENSRTILEQLQYEFEGLAQQLNQLDNLQETQVALEARANSLTTTIAQLREHFVSPQDDAKLRQQLNFAPSAIELLNEGYSAIDALNLHAEQTFMRKQQLLSSVANRVQESVIQLQMALDNLYKHWQATETAQRSELTQAQVQAQISREQLEQLQREQQSLEANQQRTRQELESQFTVCRELLGNLPDEVVVREREVYPQASYFAPDVENLGNTVPLPPREAGVQAPQLTLEQYQQQVAIFNERFDNVSEVIHTLNGENNDELTYLQANETFVGFDQRWQEVLRFCGTRQQENVELVAQYRHRCNLILTSRQASLEVLQSNPHWQELDVVIIEQAHEIEPLEVLPYLARGRRVLLLGDARQGLAPSLPSSVREELTHQLHALTQEQAAQHSVAQRAIQVRDPNALFTRLSRNWFAQLTQQAAGYNHLGFACSNQSTIARGLTRLFELTYGDRVFNSSAQELSHQWILRTQRGLNSDLVWSGSNHFVWADTSLFAEREASWAGSSMREAQLVVLALRHLERSLAQAAPALMQQDLQQRYETALIRQRVGVVVYSHAQALAIYELLRNAQFEPSNMELEIVTLDELPSMPYQYLIVSMTTEQILELEGRERLTQVEVFNRVLSCVQGMVLWLAHSELLDDLEFTLEQIDEATTRSYQVLTPVYRNLVAGCRSRELGIYVKAADLESYLRSNLGK